jgi:hypothetical protein
MHLQAVREAGNTQVKYTRIEQAASEDPSWQAAGIPEMTGHASWVHAYYGDNGKELFQWLLNHTLPSSRR